MLLYLASFHQPCQTLLNEIWKNKTSLNASPTQRMEIATEELSLSSKERRIASIARCLLALTGQYSHLLEFDINRTSTS
jgi:hypothetical protein